MDLLQRACTAIEKTESEFRELIAEAAKAGEYGDVETLTNWVLRLREISSSNDSKNSKTNSVDSPPKRKRRSPTTRGKRGKLAAYPKFANDGDNLIKIAWSKAKKNEYRHKSPKEVLSILSKALQEKTNSESVVSMDKVLPLHSPDGSEIPDYQAYLCLAWLKSIGAITQHGREGYSRGEGVNSIDEVSNSAWSKLPRDVKKT